MHTLVSSPHERMRSCSSRPIQSSLNHCGILKNGPSPASPFGHYTSPQHSCNRKQSSARFACPNWSGRRVPTAQPAQRNIIRLITPHSAIALKEIRMKSTNIDGLKKCVGDHQASRVEKVPCSCA